jgi:hypothetical protein
MVKSIAIEIAELEKLSPEDSAEVRRFMQWIGVEKSRRDGADSDACDMLESAIYPDGIGRERSKGDA